MTDGQMIQLALNIIGMVITAAAIYGGIRSDIKHLFKSVDSLEKSLSRAHERIDQHLSEGRRWYDREQEKRQNAR